MTIIYSNKPYRKMVQSRETQTYIYTINNTGLYIYAINNTGHTRATLVQSSIPIQGRGAGGLEANALMPNKFFCFLFFLFNWFSLFKLDIPHPLPHTFGSSPVACLPLPGTYHSYTSAICMAKYLPREEVI